MLKSKAGRIVLLCVSMAVVLSARLSNADEDHYNNLLIGDRATGMGGAYTAISDDPSGLYYNPAGIVYASTRNLTASVNAFNQTYKTYKNAIPSTGDDWKRSSSSLIPNFIGVVQPFGTGILGFSIAVPDSIEEDQDQAFYGITNINVFFYNLNNKDDTYKIGPSYAMELTKSLSVGMTLYWHYREKETISNSIIYNSNNSNYSITNYYLQTKEYGFEPDLGIMWSPVDKFAIGLKVGQTFVYSSSLRDQTTIITQDDDETVVRTRDTKRKHPAEVRLGLAWFASEKFLLSGDFTYYTSTTQDDNTFLDREATWNIAIGSEYFLSSQTALRFGIYSNNANTKEVETGKTNQQEHIDLWGVSASLSKYTRSSSITLGVTYAQGSGDAQLFEGDTAIQELDVYTYTLFLSTSYSF